MILMDKNKFEILKDKINAMPNKVLYNTLRLGRVDSNEFNYNMAKLSFKDVNSCEKRNISTYLMGVLKGGSIRNQLYGEGYSIGHIKIILDDLNVAYNNVFISNQHHGVAEIISIV